MSEISHGGPRKGAGRKKSSLTAKTREIAERAAAEGLTPLEIMFKAMRSFDTAGDLEKAAEIASKAAPYVHARLAAIEVSGRDGGAIEVTRIERHVVDPENSNAADLPAASEEGEI
jgi:hypothetical protein